MAAHECVVARYTGRPLESTYVAEPGIAGHWAEYQRRLAARQADQPHVEAEAAAAARLAAELQDHATRPRAPAILAAKLAQEGAPARPGTAMAQAMAHAQRRAGKRR